jgi:hypothetical protein
MITSAQQSIARQRDALGIFLQAPLTAPLYEESRVWRQMKGDLSIRGGLFLQQRFESVLDQHVETVIAV